MHVQRQHSRDPQAAHTHHHGAEAGAVTSSSQPTVPLRPFQAQKDCQQLKDCLERLGEAEKLLQSVKQAEAAVASARESLSQLCGEGGGSPLSGGGPLQRRELRAKTSPELRAAALQASRDLEEEKEEEEVEMELQRSTSHVVDEVLLPITHKEKHGNKGQHGLLLPVRSPSSPFIDDAHEAALRNPCGTWTLHDLRRGFVMVESCCGLSAPVFFPNGKYAMAWDLVGLIFIIFETFALPVYLSFNTEPQGFWLGVVSAMNVYFMVDIPLNFRRAYKEVGGQMVVWPSAIASKYYKWLPADIAAGIPWEWITPVMQDHGYSSGAGSTRWAQLAKLLRLFRVARLLRLLRIRILPENVKMFIEGHAILSFTQGCLRVIFCLFSITHWAACIWYCIGTSSGEEKTWVDAHIPAGSSFTTEYIYSLYFTLTTMTTVGYGDITPQNDTEVFFCLCLLLIATVVFATLMGALTDLICSLQGESSNLEARVRMLSHYMSWRQVPPGLFKTLRKHLLYGWETQQGYDQYELELKESLTPVLREELFYHIYGHILRSATFLSWLWDYEICMKELSTAISSLTLSRGDFLFRRGQANESAYILLSGSVRVSLNDSLHNPDRVEEEEEGGADHALAKLISGFNNSSSTPRRRAEEAEMRRRSEVANVFQSPILMRATETLQKQDMQEHWAARYVQRAWKRRKLRRFFMAPYEMEPLLLRSQSVGAPAHFGEACFWQPVDRWAEEPPSHSYSARCEARCDLATLPREQVQALLRRYSPWLEQRFDRFRRDVVEGMRRRHLQSKPAPPESPKEEVKQPKQKQRLEAAGERLAALALQSREAASKLLTKSNGFGNGHHRHPHMAKAATPPPEDASASREVGLLRLGGTSATRHHGSGLGHLDMSSHSHSLQRWDNNMRDPLLRHRDF